MVFISSCYSIMHFVYLAQLLITTLLGGPHSSFSGEFAAASYFYALLGYTVLMGMFVFISFPSYNIQSITEDHWDLETST